MFPNEMTGRRSDPYRSKKSRLDKVRAYIRSMLRKFPKLEMAQLKFGDLENIFQ